MASSNLGEVVKVEEPVMTIPKKVLLVLRLAQRKFTPLGCIASCIRGTPLENRVLASEETGRGGGELPWNELLSHMRTRRFFSAITASRRIACITGRSSTVQLFSH